jgi:acyl-coenzyme A synthetase/AMP-(fatty) acid ligase
MPENLLRRLRKVFPRVRFLQTYGTTETGIATTSSKSSDSLYMKIEDPHIQWKVVDGELWLKSDVQMLGYINYNDPFVDNGWYPTGDIVEVIEDSYIKIVGRENEIINVGGQKVFPSEVENAILELDVVLDAVVYGEDNPITGQIVAAKIIIMNDVDNDDLVKKIILHFTHIL